MLYLEEDSFSDIHVDWEWKSTAVILLFFIFGSAAVILLLCQNNLDTTDLLIFAETELVHQESKRLSFVSWRCSVFTLTHYKWFIRKFWNKSNSQYKYTRMIVINTMIFGCSCIFKLCYTGWVFIWLHVWFNCFYSFPSFILLALWIFRVTN